jgi:SsrA-binding protein
MNKTQKNITTNRRAHYDYDLFESKEAGIVLQGTEIKSIRNTGMSLAGSYVTIDNGEVWLVGSTIEAYEHGNVHNHNPTRRRKLLLHRDEIEELQGELTPGMAIIPLYTYFVEGIVKVAIALARGKKNYDKRESLKEKEHEREMRKYD